MQSEAFVRLYPSMRIASLRFHWFAPDEVCTAASLDERGGAWKDLWGWVSSTAAAQAVLAALIVPECQFPPSHEVFLIVAGTIQGQRSTRSLLAERYPEIHNEILRKDIMGNKGLFDCSKAKRMLGWEEVGYPWTA